MTSTDAASPAPQKDYGRAGRNLPAAVASGVVLLLAIAGSLAFFKGAFMLIVGAAVVVAIWELHRGLAAKDIDIPEQPLMVGGVVMVVVAYFWGAPALVTATHDDFVAAAVSLARDTDRRRELRATLRRKVAASPLLDHAGFTRKLEQALRQAWIERCSRRSA